jgi:hypothetical protein
MAAKLTRLTHKIATQLHLVAESCIPFAVLAPGGQSGNLRMNPRIYECVCVLFTGNLQVNVNKHHILTLFSDYRVYIR